LPTPSIQILALVTGSSETGGGIERFNQGLFEALSLNGTEVRLLGLVHQPTLLTKLSFVFSFLKTLCGSERFDLIFCGHLHLAFFAALLASAKAVPFWLQLHGGEAWQKPSEGIRWAVRRAALITAVSRYTRRRFLQWANVRPEKVLVLPNTYEEKFKPGPKPDTSSSVTDSKTKQFFLPFPAFRLRKNTKGMSASSV